MTNDDYMLITLFFAFVVKERLVGKSFLLMAEHNIVKLGRIKSARKSLLYNKTFIFKENSYMYTITIHNFVVQ